MSVGSEQADRCLVKYEDPGYPGSTFTLAGIIVGWDHHYGACHV